MDMSEELQTTSIEHFERSHSRSRLDYFLISFEGVAVEIVDLICD